MLLVPKKLTIDFELFANSGTNALTVCLYFALLNYAKGFNCQQIRKNTAIKIAREIVFLFSENQDKVYDSIKTLIDDSLLIDDGDGNYVFTDEIR
jgi:hypothetical protein